MSRAKGRDEDGKESKGENKFVSGGAGVIGGRSLGSSRGCCVMVVFLWLGFSTSVFPRVFNLGAISFSMSFDLRKAVILGLTGDTTGSVLILSGSLLVSIVLRK